MDGSQEDSMRILCLPLGYGNPGPWGRWPEESVCKVEDGVITESYVRLSITISLTITAEIHRPWLVTLCHSVILSTLLKYTIKVAEIKANILSKVYILKHITNNVTDNCCLDH